MNSLDLVLLIPIAVGFIFGLFKGLIRELASLTAIFLGIYGAKFFSYIVSTFLVEKFDFSPKTAQPVSYLIVFIVIVIVLLIVANMLNKLVESVALGGFNKLLGGIFGGLKIALIVSVLLNVFDALDSRFPILKDDTKISSIAYKPMLKLGPAIWDETKTLRTTY